MSVAQGMTRQDRAAAAESAAFWRYALWFERFCLAAPTLLFLRIGWKYLSAAAEVAAGSQIVRGSPGAVTDMRAFGAIFPRRSSSTRRDACCGSSKPAIFRVRPQAHALLAKARVLLGKDE